MLSLSVVIPALNEADAIGATIQRLQALAKLQSWEMEIIVVDDGSTDETGKVAHELGATVIRHPTNGGYGLSLQHGIRAAHHDVVAITDADGTYPVEELPTLYSMVVDRGFDMAVGARQGDEYRRGWWKYPARIIFRWLAEYVSGRSIPDVNSGLRVFKRPVILPYLQHTCLGFSFTTSITTIFFLNGLFIGYHPISYAKRIGQSKVRHFRDTLRTVQILVSVIARYNPIKLFLLIALIMVGLGVVSLALSFLFVPYFFLVLGAALVALSPVVFSLGVFLEGSQRS